LFLGKEEGGTRETEAEGELEDDDKDEPGGDSRDVGTIIEIAGTKYSRYILYTYACILLSEYSKYTSIGDTICFAFLPKHILYICMYILSTRVELTCRRRRDIF
jgi:hypothetical protein